MYKFDMNALLDAFDNSPEKLADAFTSQLNETLNYRRQEEDLKNKADGLAKYWNNFITEYTKFYGLEPHEEFKLRDGNDIIALYQTAIALYPEVEKYATMAENFMNKEQKIKQSLAPTVDTLKTIAQESARIGYNTYEDIMQQLRRHLKKTNIIDNL